MINKKLLIELRKDKKMTQNDVAKLINRSRQAYAFYESGKYEPDSDTLKKLAEIFKIDVNMLLGLDMPAKKEIEDNTITVYGRGTGKKVYKVSPKRLKAIQALLDEDDQSDDIDF